VDEEGGVQCWGDNSQGQLGDKTVTARSEKPVSVKGLAGSATAVGVAPNFACALLEGGTVQCWGDNTGGKLGSGSTNTPAYVPEYVQGLEGVVSLAVSNTHVCAVLGDGTVQCWGSNAWGQLGVGSTTPSSSSVPLEVIGISEATQVTAASGPYSGTCALLKGGTVKCWGYNVSGQFGSAAIGTVSVPVTIQGLVDVIEVSLGQTQVCAVSSDGDVHCAGSNAKGQLGDGSNVSSAIPVKVVGFGKATHISTASSDGYGYACAIADGGKVSCWGSNVYKTLGDGTTQNSKIPILVADTGIGDVVALSAGETSVCAVRKKGIVQCWGTQ
jgi:alpha-tubulin suppressor-like RCC1 family protein